MNVNIVVLKNEKTNTGKYRFSVYTCCINYTSKSGEFKNITEKTLENLCEANIINILQGKQPPPLLKKRDEIEISTDVANQNSFYSYFNDLLCSCIPDSSKVDQNTYLTLDEVLENNKHNTKDTTSSVGDLLVQKLLSYGSKENFFKML